MTSRHYLGVPFLGLVPVVAPKDVKGPSPLLDRGVPASFSEAMRGLRTSVIFSSAADGTRTVMVTSTAPSEGQDGRGQQSGRRAGPGRAAHADHRRRHAAAARPRDVRVRAGAGAVERAGGRGVRRRTAIRKTRNPFLSVLPAGLIPPNPAELLGSKKYLRLLEELGKDYDWIIVDAPPVMAVTDAAVISNGVGGVVFVVGAEMTPRRTAQTAMEQLIARTGQDHRRRPQPRPCRAALRTTTRSTTARITLRPTSGPGRFERPR